MSEGIKKVADEFWEWFLKENPIYATFTGDERYDDKLPDISAEHKQEVRQTLRRFLERAQSAKTANEREEVDKEVLIWHLRDSLEYLDQNLEELDIDHMYGNHLLIFELVTFQKTDTPERMEKFLERIRAYPKFVSDWLENLKRGLERGRTQYVESVRRCIGQLEELLQKPAEKLPVFETVKRLPAEHREKYSKLLADAVEKYLKKALAEVLDFLKKYKPRQKEGISFIPDGERNYKYLIKHHTTLELSPEYIHNLGKEELAKIQKEMMDVGRQLGVSCANVKGLMQMIRQSKSNFFSSREEIVKTYTEVVEKIYRKLPEFFGRLPKARVIVKPVEEYLEKDAVGAFYYRPSADGSRPGIFYINTWKPEQRPKYEVTALAVHEAVPGHHLQIAIAQELDLHPFRRHIDWDAFTEGWGLYAERLGDEMGLYEDPFQKLGMLVMQAWRAIRLVVDTGIHAFGWTREQAIRYFLDNTGLEDIEVINEVDRYIIWPAQALAYMIGMKKILELREWAKRELGSKFSIKTFHDLILEEGGIPLEILEKVFKRKIERMKIQNVSKR